MDIDTTKHPCFNADSRHLFGRVHLPIAPQCNIQCKFCDRKYDCVNESRPGVTSTILQPEQAVTYLETVLEQDPRIAVAGLAGPGDPFADPERTLRTLRLVRERFPGLILCVSSNGLGVAPHVAELARLKVSHLTITVNAVDPEIGARIYAWVRDGRRILRGREGAELLLARQLEAVRAAKAAGLVVKVNAIVIAGVNDQHVVEIARTVAALGADVLNGIPLLPVAHTLFEAMEPPPAEAMARIRSEAAAYLPQMHHCTRCRADAVGLLGTPMTEPALARLQAAANSAMAHTPDRPYVAVASLEGVLVNEHLGQADRLWIFSRQGDGYAPIEKRQTPPPGGGQERWVALAGLLRDCRAVLACGAGAPPRTTLAEQGLPVIVMEGLVEEALDAVYSGAEIRSPLRQGACACGTGAGGCASHTPEPETGGRRACGCSGDGMGCG
jgi:nitrogen fixation protein NifB